MPTKAALDLTETIESSLCEHLHVVTHYGWQGWQDMSTVGGVTDAVADLAEKVRALPEYRAGQSFEAYKAGARTWFWRRMPPGSPSDWLRDHAGTPEESVAAMAAYLYATGDLFEGQQ